jgi:NADH:ubiquinone oxidoreductase subunit 5 (subunit L)/multisubunit Na+/H+ antiporter MnhA subunit
VRPTKWTASHILVGFTDAKIIEGIVNGIPHVIYVFGLKLRRLQTGYLQHYAIVFVFGLFVLISVALITGSTLTK